MPGAASHPDPAFDTVTKSSRPTRGPWLSHSSDLSALENKIIALRLDINVLPPPARKRAMAELLEEFPMPVDTAYRRIRAVRECRHLVRKVRTDRGSNILLRDDECHETLLSIVAARSQNSTARLIPVIRLFFPDLAFSDATARRAVRLIEQEIADQGAPLRVSRPPSFVAPAGDFTGAGRQLQEITFI